MSTSLRIEEGDLENIGPLVDAQETRWQSLDPTGDLSVPRDVIASLAREPNSRPLIARACNGEVLGAAITFLWELPVGGDMLAYFLSRNGVLRYLALPRPDDKDAALVLNALLDALDQRWHQQQSQNDVVTWHSRDRWLDPILEARGFAIDGYVAFRRSHPLAPIRSTMSSKVAVRWARLEDVDALLALYLEELEFHVQYSPFCRIVPGLDSNFSQRVRLAGQSASAGAGIPRILVAERLERIVGMAECYLVGELDLGYMNTFAKGNFVYVANVSVHGADRGKGIGRLLVKELFRAFANANIDGYFLTFSAYNPLSRRFWPHLGFDPVRSIYQRRRT